MKQRLAMRVLSDIMHWSDEQSSREFAWLQLMASFKYDSYRDYIAGARFIECLADWLQQFAPDERTVAYDFVRRSLVFFSAAEIQHLVELFYPETVQRRLLSWLSLILGTPTYRVWAHPNADQEYRRLLRRALFLGLSDGARIDIFRRANAGIVSNEQVVLATEINTPKWDQLLSDLRGELDNAEARFAIAFLIDDFMGTGKTLLRNDGGQWKGRIQRFWDNVRPVLERAFEPDPVIHVHHYIATEAAGNAIRGRYEEMQREVGEAKCFRRVEFSYGMVLSNGLCVSEASHPAFFPMIQKYYDRSLEDRHTQVGGQDVRLGFGGAALPLVLEHNTPNNSIALLWAETNGADGASMRPLFRRRQRHSG